MTKRGTDTGGVRERARPSVRAAVRCVLVLALALAAARAWAQPGAAADSTAALPAAAAPFAPAADSVAASPAVAAPALAPAAPVPAPPRKPPAFRQNVAWSPDGRMLAWSEFSRVEPDTGATWNAWTATSAGTGRKLVARDASWVDWSPDGKRLVFSATRGGNEDVYSVKLDGSDVRRLTDDPAPDRHPAWSPRGDRIAFVSKRGGVQELFVMNADGSGQRRIAGDSSDVDAPAWSADASRLAWYARDRVGRDRLHIAGSDGATPAVVPTTDAGAIYPCFLPDGRLLFAALTPAGRKQLSTIEPDGTGQAVVGGIETFFARPTRDGRRLAFIAGAWPHSRVCVARGDGSAARVVVGDPVR